MSTSLFAAARMRVEVGRAKEETSHKRDSEELQRKILSQFSDSELQKFVGAPPVMDPTRVSRRSTHLDTRMSRMMTVAQAQHQWIFTERSRGMQIFRFLLGFCVIYSCMTVVYFLAWPDDLVSGWVIATWIVEGFFVAEIIAKFVTEYRDPNSNDIIRDPRLISKRYIKGWFLWDVLAVVPFYLLDSSLLWMKLIRLIRLLRLIDMLEVDKIEKPLEYILGGVSVERKMLITFLVKNVYKIFRLIIVAILLTYYVGCFWFIFADNVSTGDITFIDNYGIKEYSNFHQMLMCSYFALTTLSTVGYGDFVPLSDEERLFAIFLMIIGVTFFSYIMGNFNDVVNSYDNKMGNSDEEGEVQTWLDTISFLNPNTPIPADLAGDILKYYHFFWANDRLGVLTADDKFLNSLPENLYDDVMNYLFADIFYSCRFFFLKEFPEFRKKLAFKFLPRFYNPLDFLIQEDTRVHELLFLIEGEIEVGTVIGDRFYTVLTSHQRGFFFGDYNIIKKTKAEYSIRARQGAKVFAIPDDDLWEAFEEFPEVEEQLTKQAFGRNYSFAEKVAKVRKDQNIMKVPPATEQTEVAASSEEGEKKSEKVQKLKKKLVKFEESVESLKDQLEAFQSNWINNAEEISDALTEFSPLKNR